MPNPFQNLVNFPVCLAPMVGLSHVALRQVVRSYLPAGAKTIWPTEMLNSRRLPFEDLAKTPEAMRAQDETGLVPQILGNQECHIRPSVLRLQEWGAEGIDINMGCPVEKALRHNYGVALMGDASYAADVVRMTVNSSRLPVSVKLRAVDTAESATNAEPEHLLKFVGGLVAAGASWITLHPRTPAQKRRGHADWQQIRFLKEQLACPVIGNGDVQTSADVHRMREETRCDAVMVGRGLVARPWLLWQVGEDLGWPPPLGLEGRLAPRTPSEEAHECLQVLMHLLPLMESHFGADLALRKFRFHVRCMEPWLNFGHSLYSLVHKQKTIPDILAHLPGFFSQGVEMVPRTDLRQ